MSDDVDATLTELERRLRVIEAELEGEPAPEPPRVAPPPGAPRAEARARPLPGDPLDRFGVELRHLASELVAAWDRVVAHERQAAGARHRVLLEAQVDVHALAALERALSESPHVRDVELRAYAGGHASLLVDLGSNPHPHQLS